MIPARHHVDAVIAHGEVFFFAFFIVIMADPKAVAGLTLK